MIDSTYFTSSRSLYKINNGICTAKLELVGVQGYSSFDKAISVLPKPKNIIYGNCIDRHLGDGKCLLQLVTDGSLYFASKLNSDGSTTRFYTTLVYPVAES